MAGSLARLEQKSILFKIICLFNPEIIEKYRKIRRKQDYLKNTTEQLPTTIQK